MTSYEADGQAKKMITLVSHTKVMVLAVQNMLITEISIHKKQANNVSEKFMLFANTSN